MSEYRKHHQRNNFHKILSRLSLRRESHIFPFTKSEKEITPNFVTATFPNGCEIDIEVPTEKFIKKLVKKYKKEGHVKSGAFYLFLLTLQDKIERDHKEFYSQFMKKLALIGSITWRNCPIYYIQAFERLASRQITALVFSFINYYISKIPAKKPKGLTVAKSPLNASPRALSDVTYRSHDTRTELTNLSDPAELDELMSLSSDPKVQRKFLDLRISNKSLLVLNATLESTVKEQTDKIATMPSFEVMMETQQKQSEYLNKAPYDPNSPPLKSLPRVIFYRVAISARQFADKSREKIQGILISN
ncbi:7625_t:CDS:2 [Entrophospora sp. SA101]|nr:8500_t:CDS:2 [Entrophospora sp. SA101]CAJ0765336.1 7625_t:CDS:2 [Entrophospora sp. SA101]